MKPAIYTDPDDSGVAWLVDEHSASVMMERTTGKHLRHFETAILIQDLKPGMFRVLLPSVSGLDLHDLRIKPQATSDTVNLWRLRLAAPWICVYATITSHKSEPFARGYADPDGPEVCRGIHRAAAEVMLRLAASWNNLRTDRVTESFTFGEARIESTAPSLPWDDWSFLCAWLWSEWQDRSRQKKITLAQRFGEMKAIGYPSGIKAFEKMHGRLFPKPTHSQASR